MATPARARESFADLHLEEQVRQRAFQLYEERGNEAGNELDDWLQAEQEILSGQSQFREEE